MTVAGRTAVVTGAEGFVGSHLVERLVDLGFETRALVLYNSFGSWGWLDESPVRHQIKVVLTDVRDSDSIRRAIAGADAVFHLAALIAIPFSYEAPLSYIRTNVEGSLNVFRAALEADVPVVVHTSTSEVYGTALRVPIDEEHPLQAQSPYAASKIGADKVAESFHRSFGLPVTTLRPFNTYGPRQSARAVIPAIVSQLLAGPDVRLGNLVPTRDFTFVSDTVDAFVRAAETPAAIGRAINVGSGAEISIGALAELIGTLMGVEPRVTADEQRLRPDASEVERLVADASLARTLLGWEPAVSLEAGLRTTIDWIKDHRENYRAGHYVV